MRGLKELQILRGAAACCRQTHNGHALENEANSVQQTLQVVRRLYGVPLLQGPNIWGVCWRLGPCCSSCGFVFGTLLGLAVQWRGLLVCFLHSRPQIPGVWLQPLHTAQLQRQLWGRMSTMVSCLL